MFDGASLFRIEAFKIGGCRWHGLIVLGMRDSGIPVVPTTASGPVATSESHSLDPCRMLRTNQEQSVIPPLSSNSSAFHVLAFKRPNPFESHQTGEVVEWVHLSGPRLAGTAGSDLAIDRAQRRACGQEPGGRKNRQLEPKTFEFGAIEQRGASAFHHVGDQRYVAEGPADLRQFRFALRGFDEKHVG